MSEHQRGRLKIYMGYAAGVGKTYQMLLEVRESKQQGVDAVVGYFEPHGRKDTIALSEGLEIVPRKRIEYRGALFEEMDTEAILARRPECCAVDEFPHTNVPGSARAKRWECVQTLLEAGIHVLTTMNVQHLESLNDQMLHITGVRVRETIPDWVVHQAEEIVMVDLTPRALLNRLERGVVYGPEKAERALQNFFRESTLVALRELALRETAHAVEQRYTQNESPDGPASGAISNRKQRLRIAALVTAEPEAAMLIRRANRVADFLDAECFAITVQATRGLTGLSEPRREALERHLNFARNLHLETRILEGEDVAATLVDFARRNQIKQIFLLRPPERRRFAPFGRDLPERIVDLAKDMQVVVVSAREPERPQHSA